MSGRWSKVKSLDLIRFPETQRTDMKQSSDVTVCDGRCMKVILPKWGISFCSTDNREIICTVIYIFFVTHFDTGGKNVSKCVTKKNIEVQIISVRCFKYRRKVRNKSKVLSNYMCVYPFDR